MSHVPAATDEPPLRLAGRTLKTRHVCAFFQSKEEQNRVLMPFFKEGLELGEKVVHVVEPGQCAKHLEACAACGINTAAAAATGQLEVRSWDQLPFATEKFDDQRMIELLEQLLADTHRRFPRARLLGNMEWAVERGTDEAALLRYEARINHLVPRHPDVFVCAYDINRHNGGLLIAILRAHPMVIVGGTMQENPWYLPPDQFLQELEERPESHHRSARG
jgi:hypothetical protein